MKSVILLVPPLGYGSGQGENAGAKEIKNQEIRASEKHRDQQKIEVRGRNLRKEQSLGKEQNLRATEVRASEPRKR